MAEKASDYFRRLANSMPQLERKILNDVIAVEAERIHAENFRAEAFIDAAPQKWPARKKADKDPAKRALLVKTGTLKGHALKGRVQSDAVAFVFPLAYEKVHNEGGQAGRGAGFKMPKRQFVGESQVLTGRIKKKAEILITEHLKNNL
jgi:phage gpG-like protein